MNKNVITLWLGDSTYIISIWILVTSCLLKSNNIIIENAASMDKKEK